MTDPSQTCINMEEQAPLNLIAGSGDTQFDENNSQVIISPERTRSFCDDKHHRKLAVCSIVCGCSCIGIHALINSVKAETTEDSNRAAEHLRQAKKFGIISIVTWVSILASIPVLMALISYLLTLQD